MTTEVNQRWAWLVWAWLVYGWDTHIEDWTPGLVLVMVTTVLLLVLSVWADSCHIQSFSVPFFCSEVYSPDYDNCSDVQYVNKQPRRLGKGDFGSGRDLNHWPPPHDSSSGGDSVNHLSVIPSVSFRSNSFTICCPSPMLVQKMSKPGHGDSDSSGISTSTSLPDAGITWHATVTTSVY